MSFDVILNAFVTFFVTIDPPGLAGMFLALTSGMSAIDRRQLALRGTLIGAAILVVFMIVGSSLLATMGISINAFRVAGGLLLFYIAFEMVFEKRSDRKEDATGRIVSAKELQSLAVFPLAIPMIAGPGAISAAILLAADFVWLVDRLILIGILLSVCLLVYLFFLLAGQLQKYVGETGQTILTRLLGILLAALSVQFVVDGLKAMLL